MNQKKKKNWKKNKYEGDNLFLTVIIGVVDNHGVVHSDIYITGDNSDKTHDEIWPTIRHNKWRWSADSGIKLSMITDGDTLTPADFDSIIQHVKKIYKIRIADNGIHEDLCY